MQYALDYHYFKEDLNWYENYFGTRDGKFTSIVDYNKTLELHDCSRIGIQNVILRLE